MGKHHWLELLGGQSLQPDMSGPYDHHVFVLTSLQVNKSDEEHQEQLYDARIFIFAHSAAEG